MKNLFLLLLCIPHLLFSQDFDTVCFTDKERGTTVNIFTADSEQMQFLKVNRDKRLLLCITDINSGNHECDEVEGYDNNIEKKGMYPIDFKTNESGIHFIFFNNKGDKTKTIFKAEYDLENNTLGEISEIATIKGYTSKNFYPTNSLILTSENDKFTAILEIAAGGHGIAEKGKSLVSVILLDEEFQLINSQTTFWDLAPFSPGVNFKKPFIKRFWKEGSPFLTNEGELYFLQKNFSKFFLFSSLPSKKEAEYTFLDKYTFNQTIPYINPNCKSGIEFWAINKPKEQDEFQIDIHNSIHGEELTKRTISIAPASLKNMEFDKNDNFFLINSVSEMQNGDTYVNISPIANFPSVAMNPYKFKIKGLMLFKLEENQLSLKHEIRYKAKLVTEGVLDLGGIPFSWNFECNNKLLCFYLDSDSKDYLYKNIHTKVNAFQYDLISGEAKEMKLDIPKEAKRVKGIYPTIYSNNDKTFSIFKHGNYKAAQQYFFLFPKDVVTVYRM